MPEIQNSRGETPSGCLLNGLYPGHGAVLVLALQTDFTAPDDPRRSRARWGLFVDWRAAEQAGDYGPRLRWTTSWSVPHLTLLMLGAPWR